MSAVPLRMESSGFGSQAHGGAFEVPAAGAHEYTRRHRAAWPLLVRETPSDTLLPRKLKSWVRLWGRLGAELFDRFWYGDGFVRSDMISLARHEGGPRGVVVARKLEQWRTEPATNEDIVSPEEASISLSRDRDGSDECPKTFDELAAKLKRRFERLEDVGRQMQRELEEWSRRLDETARRLSKDGWWPEMPNGCGGRSWREVVTP